MESDNLLRISDQGTVLIVFVFAEGVNNRDWSFRTAVENYVYGVDVAYTRNAIRYDFFDEGGCREVSVQVEQQEAFRLTFENKEDISIVQVSGLSSVCASVLLSSVYEGLTQVFVKIG